MSYHVTPTQPFFLISGGRRCIFFYEWNVFSVICLLMSSKSGMKIDNKDCSLDVMNSVAAVMPIKLLNAIKTSTSVYAFISYSK